MSPHTLLQWEECGVNHLHFNKDQYGPHTWTLFHQLTGIMQTPYTHLEGILQTHLK